MNLSSLLLLASLHLSSQNLISKEILIDESILIPHLDGLENADLQAALIARQQQEQQNNQNNGNQKKDPEAFRKAFLSKLKFDRTPSGILKEEINKRNPPPQVEKKGNKPKEKSEADKKKEEQEKLKQEYQKEAENYRSNVILGEWDKVKEYLISLPEDLAKSTYSRLLQELGKPVQVKPRPEVAVMGAKAHSQKNYLSPDDVLALSEASPIELEVQPIESLARLLPADLPKSFFAKLTAGTRHFGTKTAKEKFATTVLLLNLKQIEETQSFLPELEAARKEEDSQTVNLLARYHAEAHQSDLGTEHLALAWKLSLEVMSWKKAPIKEQGEALYRALSLVAELEEGTGQEWLRKTFSDPAGEGFAILAAVGTLASQSQTVRDARFRLQQCELQHGAAEALLATENLDLTQWHEILTIYALKWLKEAELTNRLDNSSSMRPEAQWDNYGNRFYAPRQYVQNHNRNQPNPIPTGDLLELAPSDKWLINVDETVRLQLIEMIPRLYLKVKEHEKAFPLVKKLAAFKPDTARELVRSMISVWADNHNPNQSNRYRNSYYYYYGYNNRADTIPLTRSKQERNLVELSKLVSSVRELDLGESFDDEFADAFITVHSQAEVWRVEALQKVFGKLDSLNSDTIASLIAKMRINLAALWPDPKLQEQNKTKRTDKERHQQVMEGYNMAREVTAAAWGNEPESWNLLTQLASLTYEESNYLSALQSQATHSATKRTALDDFAEAAKLYAQSLPLEKENEESTAVYETWFFGALGSPLLEALKNHHMPVQSEFAKIKAALDALPDKVRERHYDSFANILNTRLANVSADLKFRYLEAALSIVGEHKEFETSRAVFDYYQDLITEIELRTTLDGSAQVGTEPFGLFVNLHHTREIEREAGGFQKYLHNQNSVSYSFNYGRPTEDYRDKFEKAARAALEEHFEVISLTFHKDKIESRTSSRIGWRYTPYAYFLLEAKGPQTDTIPPLKIDLDFLDTSGHVILPISSAHIPIVASASEARPIRELKVTMTLDERDAAAEDAWHLEIKTSGQGLVPDLKDLVSLPPKGFEIVNTDDRELQIEELTTETDDGAPLSSHEYRITLKPKGSLPAQFVFPVLNSLAKNALAESEAILRQRYQDVDLLSVGEIIDLNEKKGSSLWLGILIVFLILSGFIAWFYLQRKKQPTNSVVQTGPELPQNLTAVTLLHWLKNLLPQVPGEQRTELQREISQLEQHAFAAGGSQPALDEIANRWRKLT